MYTFKSKQSLEKHESRPHKSVLCCNETYTFETKYLLHRSSDSGLSPILKQKGNGFSLAPILKQKRNGFGLAPILKQKRN